MIVSMLTENTGKHFLDSGGAYGRAWQRNQGRDFKSEPHATLSFEYGYLEFTHNLYHWLIDRLDYNQEADNIFHEWATNEENGDKSWFQTVDEFIEMLGEEWTDEYGCEITPNITGLYGDGDSMTVNTYNHDSLLSQIIQYTCVEVEDSNILEDGIHIFLSIHGGCDARGGYTGHRIFNPNGMHGDEAILFDKDGTIGCTNCNEIWYTDDAYNWYGDNSNEDLSDDNMVAKDNNVLCPICKIGILSAY